MNDFPDWLGPIIVKELRQGLRSKAFISIFFLLQGAMIFCVLMALAVSTYDRGAASGFFWTLVGGILLVAMPIRGLGAISGEIKGNTLELLLLTQLSAWRVVMGKWVALFFQTLLLVCTLFPYVVLRYFLGGVDLTGELIGLGACLGGNALLTGIAVGTSPILNRPLGRTLLVILLILGINIIPRLIVFGRFAGGSSVVMNPWIWTTFSLLLGPLFVLLMLEFGAGKIAPPGENVAWRKRLLALVSLPIAAGIAYAFNAWMLAAGLTLLIVAPVCLGALLDKAPPIASLYRLRIGASLLQPGVATGLFFTIVVTGAFLAFLKGGSQAVYLGIAAVLVPTAAARLIRRYPPLSAYLGLQFLGVVLAIFIWQGEDDSMMRGFSGFHPTTAFLLSLYGALPKYSMFSFVLGCVSVLSFLALVSLIIAAVRERIMIRQIRTKEETGEILPVVAPTTITSETTY